MYAVFGVSRELAKKKAVKETPVADKETRRFYTLEEYTALLKETECKFFESMNPTQLSPVYSNLTEARRYLEMAQKAGSKKLHIKRRLQHLNGDGEPMLNDKTKKPMLYWDAA